MRLRARAAVVTGAARGIGLAISERFVREGNYLDASQQYAYAVVLCDRKERDAEPWRVSLRSTAVAAGID